jgi:hypothetical protein
MTEPFMVAGVLYFVGSLVSSFVFGMLASRSDARVTRCSGDKSLGVDIARLQQLGHTEEEIARLVAYRVAVRAGFVSDEVHARPPAYPRLSLWRRRGWERRR